MLYYRIAPRRNTDGTYTAGSKPQKFTVSSYQKPPNVKVKDGKISVKANTYVQEANGAAILYERATKNVLVSDGTKVWLAATPKKPASAVQTLVVPAA